MKLQVTTPDGGLNVRLPEHGKAELRAGRGAPATFGWITAGGEQRLELQCRAGATYDILAAGLTPSELRNLLSNRLTEYVPTPNVAVIVTDVRSFKISVLGHVSRPGRFEVKSRTTVLEALSLAGGLDPFASRSRIVILRSDRKTTQRIRFDYSRAINRSDGFWDKIVNLGGGYQENFYLRPGDIVLVP